MRPRTKVSGRALRRVRSRMASPTATAMPCSTPTTATTTSVIRARKNSQVEKRMMRSRSRPWKIRVATKMSTAAKVARGTSVRRPAAGMRATMTSGGAESGGLGPAPGGRHGRRAGRAGVDGEGSDQSGQDAAGAHADEVTSHVDVVSPGGGEGAGGGGRLAHDHQGHDGGHGKDVAERRPRQVGQAHVGGGVGHGAQSGDAPGVEAGDGHHHGRADEAEQGAGDASVDPVGRHAPRRTRPGRWPGSSRWWHPGAGPRRPRGARWCPWSTARPKKSGS